jgi:transcriptional regulator with XRE-family HTH domain
MNILLDYLEKKNSDGCQVAFGDKMRDIRIFLGLNVHQFSNLLELAPQTIYYWEKKKVVNCTNATLKLISLKLKVPLKSLQKNLIYASKTVLDKIAISKIAKIAAKKKFNRIKIGDLLKITSTVIRQTTMTSTYRKLEEKDCYAITKKYKVTGIYPHFALCEALNQSYYRQCISYKDLLLDDFIVRKISNKGEM